MKSAAVVAASSFNATEFLCAYKKRHYDEIIAVDAGYSHLQHADLQRVGVFPTRAVGDFDSLGFVPHDVIVQQFPEEKDMSDLDLALKWCAQGDFDVVEVYGAFAGRIDHTLAALQAMTKYAISTQKPIEGVAEAQRMVVMPAGWRLSIPQGEQPSSFCALSKDQRAVSVISLVDTSQGVTVQGMKYELMGGTLTNCCSLGLSNELIGNNASVSLEQGCVLVTLPLGIAIQKTFLTKS